MLFGGRSVDSRRLGSGAVCGMHALEARCAKTTAPKVAHLETTDRGIRGRALLRALANKVVTLETESSSADCADVSNTVRRNEQSLLLKIKDISANDAICRK